jgi:hypothetical protein
MKSFRTLHRLVLSAAALCALATAAHAQGASHYDTPLMVVRFNQERVYYQQPLYGALSRALQAKQGVVFNIISLVPETGNKRADKKLMEDARKTTGVFVSDMMKMGIPENRIRVSYQGDRGVEANEVHMFVE